MPSPHLAGDGAPLPGGKVASDREAGLGRLSVLHFLGALVLLLTTMPLVLESIHGELIEDALFTLVLLTAVPAVGGRRRTLLTAIALVIPAVAGRWLAYLWPNVVPRELGPASGRGNFVIARALARGANAAPLARLDPSGQRRGVSPPSLAPATARTAASCLKPPTPA